jgi:chemotaxis protein CheX
MPTEVTPETVMQIVESIFVTMMDLNVCTVEAPSFPVGEHLTSSVYLEGAWNGAVSLECNRQQACHFAGKFLSMDPPDTVDDDVRDALGELANMIGGNLKSVMATDVRLSMPSVIDGTNYELRVCGSGVHQRIGFQFDGGEFCVTVSSRDGSKAQKVSAHKTMHGIM